LRFGGWCTTADLLGIATGFSPYEYYLRNEEPDWEEVFKEKENKKFSIIVLNKLLGNETELNNILVSDLRKYITLK